jgi:hypothetical protein
MNERCEETAIGLKLPEDGVNKHRNVWEQELICEWRNAVKCTVVGEEKGSAEHGARYVRYWNRLETVRKLHVDDGWFYSAFKWNTSTY